MLITTKRVFLSVDCGYHAADSRFQIPDSRFQIPGTGFQPFSVELGLWIPIVSGIPDFLNCIPDSKAQDSGLRKQIFPDSGIREQKFPGFWNPLLTWGDAYQ